MRDETVEMPAAELPFATISEHDGVRFLHLDTPWVQGAMLIREPRVIVLEYVQRMMAWMLWRPSAEVAAGHAVQLGLGAASITRFCHSVLRMPRVTAVFAVLPFVAGMSGVFYLGGALVLGGAFLYYAIRLLNPPDELYAMKVFNYSIVYLMALFAFLLADHWLLPAAG